MIAALRAVGAALPSGAEGCPPALEFLPFVTCRTDDQRRNAVCSLQHRDRFCINMNERQHRRRLLGKRDTKQRANFHLLFECPSTKLADTRPREDPSPPSPLFCRTANPKISFECNTGGGIVGVMCKAVDFDHQPRLQTP